ncbi:hypothetical protein ID0623_11820 [Helicobacter pylori]
MYAHIDRGIEDDECKRKFKYELQQSMKELDRTIKGRVKKCEEQFRKDIQKTIERFEERIKNSLAIIIREHINANSGFDFNIDSGINALGLTASIGGLIALLVTPLGEFALAAGIVLGLIGIVKSLWSFFSSDYKKSQQRKEVDKNLEKVCEKIAQDVESQIESGKKAYLKSLKA